jgi:hypothetical protein
LAAPTEVLNKKDMAKDIRLLFSDRIKVKFTKNKGETNLSMGRWCLPCRQGVSLLLTAEQADIVLQKQSRVHQEEWEAKGISYRE